MPELIHILDVKSASAFLVYKNLIFEGVKTISMRETKTYTDLQRMFGPYFSMPGAESMRGDVYEYRCPYHHMCPANGSCFIAATPEPLREDVILNVKCRLVGNQKIPVYAGMAARIMK